MLLLPVRKRHVKVLLQEQAGRVHPMLTRLLLLAARTTRSPRSQRPPGLRRSRGQAREVPPGLLGGDCLGDAGGLGPLGASRSMDLPMYVHFISR